MNSKFEETDRKFHANISKILEIDIPKIDLIHGFPLFTGHVNLARYLFFYDLYKEVYKLSGDIADVGTWKGYSFLFFAKLVKIFEPLASTRVHAYDWFQGMLPQTEDDKSHEGEYRGSYDILCNLIALHELSGLAVVNKLDLEKDLPEYFESKENHSLRFKLCFIDCGIKNVLEESLKYFYPRIVKGGILVMDHYNCPVSPYESEIVEKYAGNNQVLHSPYTRAPTGYLIKQ